jgi:xanthine dehydrogenase accessory factor
MSDFYERVATLRRTGEVFAVATVVGRRPPVSAHVGDHAIVFLDGRMEGFVGGACSREIVRQQAREALQSGQGRLVSIRPDATASSGAEHVVVPMSCASEGAIDVYIEPCVRPHSLVVVGTTPVAAALARLGRALDYDVVRVVDAREQRQAEADSPGERVEPLDSLEALVRATGSNTAVVVASQGHYDEDALASALKAGAGYVGLVASHKRGAVIRTMLEENGVAGTSAIRTPAGLDLGARTPAEVGLSILAEIVKARPAGAADTRDASNAEPATGAATAIDPVCGMRVEIATARHTTSLGGVEYYFCGAGCRAAFVKDPQNFLQPHS